MPPDLSLKRFILKNTVSLRRPFDTWATRRAFRRQFETFRKLSERKDGSLPVSRDDTVPCLGDTTRSVSFDPHYLYHMAWEARAVRSLRPAVHTDISSHLHFCAIVSAFVPVMHYEYRPPRIRLPGLECRAGDLLSLPMEDDSVPSLSCMHVIEHIGLGRYGDALDAEGDHKALAELRRVVAPGGSLLIAVPVGRPRVAFNAHRVYAFRHIVDRFPTWDLRECALVSDDPKEGLMTDATETEFDRQSYGCGCFWFVKPTR